MEIILGNTPPINSETSVSDRMLEDFRAGRIPRDPIPSGSELGAFFFLNARDLSAAQRPSVVGEHLGWSSVERGAVK